MFPGEMTSTPHHDSTTVFQDDRLIKPSTGSARVLYLNDVHTPLSFADVRKPENFGFPGKLNLCAIFYALGCGVGVLCTCSLESCRLA